MNRHLKIAFMVAPFLLIGGYIAADYFQTSKQREYLESRGPQFDARALLLDNPCALVTDHCILYTDGMKLDLYVAGGRYRLDSKVALDDAVMSLAQKDRETRVVRLSPHDNDRRQWSTAIRRLTNLDLDAPLNIRLVARRNDTQYYAEIPVKPTGPWQ
jgi:hypothetical protein